MTSTGRLLAGSVKDRNGLAQALEEVLDAYAKLPEAERRPKAVEGEIEAAARAAAGRTGADDLRSAPGTRRRAGIASPKATISAACGRTRRTASAARCG